MNRLFICTWVGLLGIPLATLTGCGGPNAVAFSSPTGKEPTTASRPVMGKLIVYSAWDRFDTLDAEHRKHTPYTVSSGPSERRAVVAKVRNQAGSFGADPELVELPAGQYWVEARATNEGRVRVPVMIRPGEPTILYLDSTTSPGEQGIQAVNWVR